MNEVEKRRQREVQAHLIRQVLAAHEEGSAPPELLDLVGGSTIEEVDASLARVKATSAQLVQRARQEQQGLHRPADQDCPGPGFAANVRAGTTRDDADLAARVNSMSMSDYAQARARGEFGVGQKDLLSFLGGA